MTESIGSEQPNAVKFHVLWWPSGLGDGLQIHWGLRAYVPADDNKILLHLNFTKIYQP